MRILPKFKNVLYETLNNEFEYEYKKRSLLSKESEPTGRVILKEEDYKTLKEQADFGKEWNQNIEN